MVTMNPLRVFVIRAICKGGSGNTIFSIVNTTKNFSNGKTRLGRAVRRRAVKTKGEQVLKNQVSRCKTMSILRLGKGKSRKHF